MFWVFQPHLDATVKYVELNPVKAKLCKHPQDWRWSSVHAHLSVENDGLVSVRPMLEKFPNWAEYLEKTESENEMQRIQMHTRTGRPLGSDNFVEMLEVLSGKSLKLGKPGPKTD
jgi:putative transposase